MSHYFGTDGFRGEAGITLTAEHAYRIGRFLAWHYSDEGEGHARIVIGRDTRRSGHMLECALVAGLTASGADAYLLHVTTTPGVSFVAAGEHFDCGVMISASHNPYNDNGIKLVNARGEKMEEETIEKLEAYLDGGYPLPHGMADLPFAHGERIGRVFDHAEGQNRYIRYLMSLADHDYKPFRVGLDCANGSASAIAPGVFEALGAETHVIHAAPSGLNINREAGSTHIEALTRLVREKGLDIGFAFDGDADRCLAVDERGEVVNGDHILYLLACDKKRRGLLTGNTVVTTVMSNLGLYRALEEVGIRYTQTKVGDKYVYEEMQKGGYAIGGEQSGHIILGEYATKGDGILTAICLMEVMAEGKQPLSRLTAPVKMYPQVLKNLRVTDKAAVREHAAVQAEVERIRAALGSRGRILLRESGTEPVIRVMVEADTPQACEAYADAVLEKISALGLAEV